MWQQEQEILNRLKSMESANQAQSMPESKSVSALAGSCSQLETAVRELAAAREHLAGKLGPVLKPEPSSVDDPGVSKPAEPVSDLRRFLDEQTARVFSQTYAIRSMIDNLDL